MERYRIAYKINGNLKFKNINAKNEKTLKNRLNKNYSRIEDFKIVYYRKIYDFEYGIFNDISRHFVKNVVGNTPQETMRNAFKVLGDNVRKQRYKIKPFNLSKEQQAIYNKEIKKFDKYVMEELKNNE